jgi:hypothetical protein
VEVTDAESVEEVEEATGNDVSVEDEDENEVEQETKDAGPSGPLFLTATEIEPSGVASQLLLAQLPVDGSYETEPQLVSASHRRIQSSKDWEVVGANRLFSILPQRIWYVYPAGDVYNVLSLAGHVGAGDDGILEVDDVV